MTGPETSMPLSDPCKRAFSVLLATRACLVAASLASVPYLVLLLSPHHGIARSVFAASVLMTAGSVASIPIGLFIDRAGFRPALIVGCVTSLVVWAFLVAVSAATLPYGIVLACCVVKGCAIASHITAINVGVSTILPANHWRWGYARSELARVIGSVAGPALVLPLASVAHYTAIFVGASVLYGLGAAAAYWLLRCNTVEPKAREPLTNQRAPHQVAAWPLRWTAGALLLALVAYASIAQVSLIAPVYFADMGITAGIGLIMVGRSIASAIVLAIGTARFQSKPKTGELRGIAAAAFVLWSSFVLGRWAPPVASLALFASAGILFDCLFSPSVSAITARLAAGLWRNRVGMAFAMLSLLSAAGNLITSGIAVWYPTAVSAGTPARYWGWFAIALSGPLGIGLLLAVPSRQRISTLSMG